MSAAIHLTRILAGKCSPAVTPHPAVRIHNNLSPGQPAIAVRPTHHKFSGWIDVINRIPIQQMRGHHLADHFLFHIPHNLLVRYVFIVLRGNHHCMHASRFGPVVFHRHLCFAIGTQIRKPFVLANLSEFCHQLVRQGNGQRHQYRCFSTRISKHHPLIARALLGVQSFPRCHPLRNIGRLLV